MKLAIASCATSFVACVSTIAYVYYRERAAAMYSSMPYSAAQAIVEVRSLIVV